MSYEQWWHDLRLAWRGLIRARGFAGAAVLTLAVGIGGTTAMFALIRGVLLRALPVREPQQLVLVWQELRSTGATHWPFRSHDIDLLRAASQTLESVAGVGYNGISPLAVVDRGSASYIGSAPVSGSFFQVLGVEPLLGRALDPADDVSGAENVLVMTHGAWQRRYGGSRDVIGRRVLVKDQPFTIVGVMPPDVVYPHGVEAWLTIAAAQTVTSAVFREAVANEVDVMARLRPGVTIQQAAGELRGLAPRLEADAPAGATRGLSPVVHSFEDVTVGDVRPALLVLFGAVALVLLIASANVANLMLMRSEARRSELAVRAALGASRGRLARQLLAESAVLSLAAGIVGLAVTRWTLAALLARVPDGMPRIDSVRVDSGVVLFTLAVAFATAALAGLIPAWSAARLDLASELRSGGRGSPGKAGRHGRRLLVVVQVALAVAIVAAAGLLARSLRELQAVDLGLPAPRLVSVRLALPEAKYAERTRHLQFLNDVVARLEAAPMVGAATPVNRVPFTGRGWDAPTFTWEGQSREQAAANASLNLEAIHPNYFKTFEVTLVRGRAFNEDDRQAAPAVVIVSADVLDRGGTGDSPIGKRLKLGGPDSQDPWRTVVGVARPTRYRELREPRATLYLPAEQFIVAAQTLVLRTTAPLPLITGVVRERIRAVDPDVQVMGVSPFAALLDEPLARPRFNALLIGAFGGAAVMLATIGLYVVMAASVHQRDKEIAIRVALGASAPQLRRLVVGEGLRLAGLGAAIGLAGAIAATRVMHGLLFNVHPLDPASLLAAVVLLLAVSALASYLPARAATQVDPIAALRAQ